MKSINFFPLLLFKLITSLDGYFYFALSPILVFLVSKDIKIMGLFFLIESLVKFLSYGASGTIANTLNQKNNLYIAQLIRVLASSSSILFFCYGNEDKIYYMLICNLLFVMANSLLSTNFDILVQKRHDFTVKTQSNISAGDLFAGTFSFILVLLLIVTKTSFEYFSLVIFIMGIISLISIHFFVIEIGDSNSKSILETIKNVIDDLICTTNIIKKDKDILQNIIIGYIPFSFFIIIEQINIVDFAHRFDYHQMQIFHFVVKICLFFIAGITVPFLMQKMVKIHSLLLTAIICMSLGGLLSFARFSIIFDLIGVILLGISHTLVLNFRKVKRRNIMVSKNISFSTLGFLFAIEGLSGVFANAYLSLFGKNLLTLSIFFLFGMFFLIRGYWNESKTYLE